MILTIRLTIMVMACGGSHMRPRVATARKVARNGILIILITKILAEIKWMWMLVTTTMWYVRE